MGLLEEAKQLFESERRPEHFTDHEHCCECAEHDEALRATDCASLSHEHVAPGWDPFCFVNIEGFKYYFPALVRLAIDGTGDSYFIDRFIFHLELDGPENSRYLAFTPEQRNFVVRVLEYLVENRSEEIEANLDTDNLFRTLAVWSGAHASE